MADTFETNPECLAAIDKITDFLTETGLELDDVVRIMLFVAAEAMAQCTDYEFDEENAVAGADIFRLAYQHNCETNEPKIH